MNFSCRKADYIVAPQYNNHLAERFLKLPPSSPPEIIRIANKLRELNKLHGFLNYISEKHGFARWDKTIFAKKSKSIRAGRTTSSSDTIIYIPLVPENTGYVKSFILARLNGSITLELHNRGNYPRYGFYKDENVTNSADKLALQFFILENKVFGKTAFKIIDNKLFSTPLEDTFNIKKHITIEPYINPAAGIETNIYQVCREVSALKCPSQGACCGDAGPGNGNCCKDCWGIKLECKLVSVVVFTDDIDYDLPPPPPPETGGGGTATDPDGTETSPPTTCSNSPQMEDGLPPCAAELAGWLDGEGPLNGELEPVVNPCDQAHLQSKKMDSLFIKSKIDSVINNHLNNYQSLQIEKGFPIYKKYEGHPYEPGKVSVTGYYTGNIVSGTADSISIQFQYGYLTVPAGWLHIHPKGKYSGPSAFDMYALIEAYLKYSEGHVNKHFEGNFILGADGAIYAITVSDKQKAMNFLTTKNNFLDNEKWKEDSEIGKTFEKATKFFETEYKGNSNQFNLAYEMAMAAVLSQYNAGVRLNKKDASGNFKPIVVKTSPNPKKPKKTIYTQDCL